MLSDAAQRRLEVYCHRAVVGAPEFVERPFAGGSRSVRYIDRTLRELIWNDVEVRTALLDPDGELLARFSESGLGLGLALLDLRSGMSLERETRSLT